MTRLKIDTSTGSVDVKALGSQHVLNMIEQKKWDDLRDAFRNKDRGSIDIDNENLQKVLEWLLKFGLDNEHIKTYISKMSKDGQLVFPIELHESERIAIQRIMRREEKSDGIAKVVNILVATAIIATAFALGGIVAGLPVLGVVLALLAYSTSRAGSMAKERNAVKSTLEQHSRLNFTPSPAPVSDQGMFASTASTASAGGTASTASAGGTASTASAGGVAAQFLGALGGFMSSL